MENFNYIALQPNYATEATKCLQASRFNDAPSNHLNSRSLTSSLGLEFHGVAHETDQTESGPNLRSIFTSGSNRLDHLRTALTISTAVLVVNLDINVVPAAVSRLSQQTDQVGCSLDHAGCQFASDNGAVECATSTPEVEVSKRVEEEKNTVTLVNFLMQHRRRVRYGGGIQRGRSADKVRRREKLF
jgi:hypothetical protein